MSILHLAQLSSDLMTWLMLFVQYLQETCVILDSMLEVKLSLFFRPITSSEAVDLVVLQPAFTMRRRNHWHMDVRNGCRFFMKLIICSAALARKPSSSIPEIHFYMRSEMAQLGPKQCFPRKSRPLCGNRGRLNKQGRRAFPFS